MSTVRRFHQQNNIFNGAVDTTFLSSDDFYRAQNMSFSETEPKASVIMPLNDPEMHYTYYEGDMMIQESDEKKVAMYTAKRWPYGRIPYVMENKFTDQERAAIARGMMILQERTCIRFVPKKQNDHDYVLIKRGPGCAAHVGKIGGQQWVILGQGCYGIETVTHELMHSVGFIHEQSRPDRDEHVEIVWNNIKSTAKRNFRKHETDYLADHGFPYDLMSVMHYRQYAFSKNRKPTILPKRPVPYLRCRGLDCPSELDIEKINFLYKCHKKDDFEDNYIDDAIDNNEIDIDDTFESNNHIHRQINPHFYQNGHHRNHFRNYNNDHQLPQEMQPINDKSEYEQRNKLRHLLIDSPRSSIGHFNGPNIPYVSMFHSFIPTSLI
ncbi:hypothetical protein DERP_004288 [Dermatophagoides pteronyssinus]|uniref:Metalloendopeptidase n=1 Tax=Dermatophagoides pteronyssinus TaxID=6956 RepID=A0ABQ8JP75_DERPT|nr:hypothetical protein DERP_004288 [Dermatophagoides pteronyssinus]